MHSHCSSSRSRRLLLLLLLLFLQLQFSSPISPVFSAVEKGGGNNWKTKAEKFQPLKNYFEGAWRGGTRHAAAASKKAAREEN